MRLRRGEMSSALEGIVKRHIAAQGPMDIGAFMSLALSHPEHGYYMKQDPFGAAGDFTTAPEVSQMFGEMLGAWAADLWMQMGAPARFIFLECGPGRGTLMRDMLRGGGVAPGFTEAAEVHLMEISPALQAKQAETLAGFNPQWHEGLESVPDDVPIIMVGNEFLDALPFRQFEKTESGWQERVVVDEDGLNIVLKPVPAAMLVHIPQAFQDAKEGSVYEFSLPREAFVNALAERFKVQGGMGLFIDYGHARSGLGDTFQALYKHEYCGVLEHIGDADLTSHVDFEALVRGLDVPVYGPRTQGAFLKALGIAQRAAMLAGSNPSEDEAITGQLERLTGADEMGTLFKVLALGVHNGFTLNPAGF